MRETPYLRPYLDAAAVYGAGFGSLLWASPATQAARFDAIARIAPLAGKSVLDVGCGRADLLEYLLLHGITPADYIGIEAVDALVNAAQAKNLSNARILHADFVADPAKMFVAADVTIFSGSLNTLSDGPFYATLQRAFDATAEALVFNYLSTRELAGRDYLHWRRQDDLLRFAQGLSPDVRTLQDYLPGDMTVRIGKTYTA